MSRWETFPALFVDGPWAGEHHDVIIGVRYLSAPDTKTKWWQVGLLRPLVIYQAFRIFGVAANGYPVKYGQTVFAINPPRIEVAG